MSSSPADSLSGGAEPQRLAKRVAALVPCSRSQAEQYITEGWVRVDGRVVDLPQARVHPAQQVVIEPKARLQPVQPATFLFHQPAGTRLEQALELLGPAQRWSGDASGIRPTRAHRQGLAALLELPAPASGLAVFSQDGRIIRRLTEDAGLIEQELLADVAGTIAPGGLERLARGLAWQGRPLPPARVSWQSERRLRFAVKGIAPQLLPWMCAQVGLELTALRRLRLGRIAVAGLPPGQWRYLRPTERF